MPGILDFPKFNYEDLEEIVADGQGLVTQVVIYLRTASTPLFFNNYAASRLGKYPPLFTDTEVSNCFSIYHTS